MTSDRIIVLGLLAESHLVVLREHMPRVIPLPSDGKFDELLDALSELGGQPRKP